VVAVVLFHANMPGVSGGFVAWNVFFVISGFLITGLLCASEHHRHVGLGKFYGGPRAPTAAGLGHHRRITMIGSVSCYPRYRPGTSSSTASPARSTSATTGSFSKASTTSGGMVPVAVPALWSLGVEEQFYLIWPGPNHWHSVG